MEDLSIDYPVPTVQQLEVLEANPDADEMLCEVCGETPFRVEDNRLVFQAEDRELRPYWCMPFEANRHLVYRLADQRLYEPKQPTMHCLEGTRQLRLVHPNRLYQPGQRLVLRDAHRPAPVTRKTFSLQPNPQQEDSSFIDFTDILDDVPLIVYCWEA